MKKGANDGFRKNILDNFQMSSSKLNSVAEQESVT